MVHKPFTLTCAIAYSPIFFYFFSIFLRTCSWFVSVFCLYEFSFRLLIFFFHFSIACVSREIPNSADVIYRCEGGKQVQGGGKTGTQVWWNVVIPYPLLVMTSSCFNLTANYILAIWYIILLKCHSLAKTSHFLPSCFLYPLSLLFAFMLSLGVTSEFSLLCFSSVGRCYITRKQWHRSLPRCGLSVRVKVTASKLSSSAWAVLPSALELWVLQPSPASTASE